MTSATGHRQCDSEHHWGEWENMFQNTEGLRGLGGRLHLTGGDLRAPGGKCLPGRLGGSQTQTGAAERVCCFAELREAAIATAYNRVISGCLKLPNTAAPT